MSLLTWSPVAASPSNVSTAGAIPGFHYASASPPRNSPSRTSAALPQTRNSASSSSCSSTPQPYARTKRHVGVDATTQYSPSEPFDYRTGRRVSLASGGDEPRVSPRAPAESQPRAPFEKHRPGSRTQELDSDEVMRESGESVASFAPPMSPIKRKVLEDSGAGDTLSMPERQGSPALAKRTKQEEALKILPQKYEFCAIEDVVVLIANMLSELIETNDKIALKSGSLTRFHSRTAPGISVLDYLQRIAKHATLTPPLLLSMVYYIDRLCVSYSEFTINTLTVHRFLITAATVAAKGLSDAFWNNSTYARVGGVRVAELKLLELEFLYRVDWKIVPNPEVLVAYYRGLVERCKGYQLEEEGDGASDDDGEDSSIDEDELEECGAPVNRSLDSGVINGTAAVPVKSTPAST